ncbi:hydrogenase maturation nickel metallochaperone HypA [Sulfuricurvum sp. RIFCSPLOWO2_12_FULL_43_24]|uniref:hydrogenase maturation nickel metallochaperone HypA n=1 Tax=Sulfuricurvum sp. RIFCSPLOWO2_12_FULL_43_24 TaxID=1802247 RepID=UPI0008D512C2|nr:hydrogenase maturation nickel metallochaperone HypA [Sulfuricurvum sp. RIFCSPLOWO2_12_FULL_43_24]OHD84776.1 MAG: hydrogenase maturation nickel metallochaperone HypA [Sulfuricurvum sp. RIFCSPHIGHO2_02_FULL_43_9]OHD85797.1 MAG: hydrogenase maturation nickel metallochaperone HypA [Sulfuricurvum sp. RIFCSPLOWO2_02_43_6]OHD89019.1 MAG: hydrogenase maturation nickel metallochaperone HypA [Sulfuricurvum sp. RIFCSPHIGHO2_12_FULL_44_8]OHD91328.1 MAG: hydrogenase maturation nickel metallochaperone Hyp
MHEYSIVQALLTQCEDIARENEAESVTKIVVKIGKMSGVEPHLLEIAFNTFKEKTVCDGADFVLNVQPLVIECKQCGTATELSEIYYKCPACESLDVKVIDGEDMYLMTLEME